MHGYSPWYSLELQSVSIGSWLTRERDAIHVRNVTSRSFWQLPLRASSRDESNRGLSLPDLAIFLVLGDITIGGCLYQSDERVRFTLLLSLPSLSLLFLLLLLSLPASRARREKKMRGSRSFIPRRMLRRNYHAAWSRCTRASVHTRPRHSNNWNICACVSRDLAVFGTFQINVSGSCRFAHTDSRWHLRPFPRLDIFFGKNKQFCEKFIEHFPSLLSANDSRRFPNWHKHTGT